MINITGQQSQPESQDYRNVTIMTGQALLPKLTRQFLQMYQGYQLSTEETSRYLDWH